MSLKFGSSLQTGFITVIQLKISLLMTISFQVKQGADLLKFIANNADKYETNSEFLFLEPSSYQKLKCQIRLYKGNKTSDFCMKQQNYVEYVQKKI